MKSARLITALLLLVQNSSQDEAEVQSFYVPQFTSQANSPSPSLASLTPAPSRPLEIIPFNPAPVNSAPVNPAPVNPAPVNPSPVNPQPVNPQPVNPAPVNPIPVNPQLVNPAPVNPAPVNPAPVNPTPVNAVVNQPLDDFLQQPPPEPNQECYIRQCDQIITGRNLLYSRALEIVQNEDYLSEADLDLIRKRYKRQANTSTSDIFSTAPLENVDLLPTLISIGVGIGTVAAGALYAIPDLPLTLPSGVPPGNPEPGTPGGGGPPNTLPQAVALVPPGLNAIAVFPPYIRPRTVPAISVIFAENPAIGTYCWS